MTELAKPALRTELRAARNAFLRGLGPGERERLEARAAAHLAPLLEGAGVVAFYQALGSELGCGPAIAAAAASGMTIALPHVSGRDHAMHFLAWAPGEPLEPGWGGLLQPCAGAREIMPDVIVTPLLGFDSALARLGQGAGFYDRAFAARASVNKIAWAWSIQRRPAIACDPWDVPLDAVVTEADVIERSEA